MQILVLIGVVGASPHIRHMKIIILLYFCLYFGTSCGICAPAAYPVYETPEIHFTAPHRMGRCIGLARRIMSVRPSVCLSVKRVHCDKTKERSF